MKKKTTNINQIKRITRQQVAAAAGVSPAAVTVALGTGRSTAGFSKATIEHVRKIAKQLNYRPHQAARSLAAGKSFLIAVLVPLKFSIRIPELMEGLQKITHAKDYSIILYCSKDLKHEQQLIRLALDRHVDGMILTPDISADGRHNAKYIEKVNAEGLPMVQVDENIISGICSVRTDYIQSGRLATRHLIEQGRKTIVHVTHPEYEDNYFPGTRHDAKLRAQGYIQEMEAYQLKPEIFTLPHPTAMNWFEDAGKLADRLVKMHKHLDGIVAYNDKMALGLIRGFAFNGQKVPQEIAIVGFDNTPMSQYTCPSLTTLERPLLEMAKQAASILFDEEQSEPTDKLFPPKLIIRESSTSIATSSTI